jgi:predicted metal-dependent peptidase
MSINHYGGNMETEAVNYDLNMDIYYLLREEPFFATFSRNINKSSTTAIPTAGVRINKETQQFEMVYNPSFFAKLEDKERIDVLKHEFYHVIFEHVTGRLPPEGMTKMWNIATDLAINSHLPNIPKIACIPGVGKFANYPAGLSGEQYFDLLKDDPEMNKEPQEGEGDPNFDDHEGWGDGEIDNTMKEIAKENLKEALKKAAKEASSKNWGSVPADVRKQIMDKLEATVDWRKMLRYFIKTSQRADKNSTVRKVNKRFPRIHAGKKVNRVAKIAISIDQSGSVSDEMLALFFTELNELSNLATFTVIPFDTRVDEKLVYEWKKGKRHVWERVMCGGTCFNAPTKFVNEGDWDGHIVLTDMCAPKPISSRPSRMWMTDKANAANPYFKTNELVVAVGK